MLENDNERLRHNLAEAMRAEGVRKVDLARACDVSEQAVGNWLKTGKIARHRLPSVARAVKRSVDELLGYRRWNTGPGPEVREPAVSRYARTDEIPIVGKTQGGTGGYWEELGYPVGYGAEVIDAVSNDQNAYALIVEGNSMAPRVREGEAILVEPNRECHPGDEVVVRLVDGEVAVKSFVSRRDGRITLDSLSPDFERRVVRIEDIVIMHFVAGVFRAGAIREATIRTDDYEGPERRQMPMSSEEFANVHKMPERREETPWVYEGRYKTRQQRERERNAKGAPRGKKGAK